jgi:hypothetical protein
MEVSGQIQAPGALPSWKQSSIKFGWAAWEVGRHQSGLAAVKDSNPDSLAVQAYLIAVPTDLSGLNVKKYNLSEVNHKIYHAPLLNVYSSYSYL